MAVCVAAGGLIVALAINHFTLAWTHSIEKVRWEEDYRVEGTRLHLTEARILGSGAGMEPPPDSRLVNGVWHYDPHLQPLSKLRLTHSTFTAGYEICYARHCTLLSDSAPLAGNGDVVEVSVCRR